MPLAPEGYIRCAKRTRGHNDPTLPTAPMTLNGVQASTWRSDRDSLLRLYGGPSQPKSYHLGARGLTGWIPHLGRYVTYQDFSTAFWYLRGRDPAYTPR